MSFLINPFVFATAGGGGGDFGSHQYWRVFVTANGGDGSFTTIYELEFRATAGGADLTGAGTPISGGSGSESGTEGPDKAFDNNTGTVWGRSSPTNTWVGYNFGSAVTVAEFAMFCGTATEYDRMPHTFSLDYSDNGTDWTTAESFTAQGWNNGIWDAYPKAELGANEARMWRVYIPTVNSGTLTICTDLQWRATVGGADQSPVLTANEAGTSGRAVYSTQNSGNEAYRAYDSTATGANGWAGNAAPQWIGFVFPAPVTVAQIAYTGWSDASKWCPTEIQVQYSNDNGSSWTTAATHSSLTWTNSEQKLLAV